MEQKNPHPTTHHTTHAVCVSSGTKLRNFTEYLQLFLEKKEEIISERDKKFNLKGIILQIVT